MNIIEKLKSLNVEINEDIEKSLGGDYISIQEHEKKMAKVETERDKWKADAETATETLKGFEGKDFEQLTQDVATWKEKAEKAEKDYAEKLQKRDYSDAIKELTKDIKFTSNSARNAFMADLDRNPLQMRDGKVLGFDDYLKNYKETDADAFVSDREEARSHITRSLSGGSTQTTADPNKMDFQAYKAWRNNNN